jgi:hypothetical protein
MPQLSAQAVTVTTEDAINKDSRSDSDLARVRAFVSRNDVITQLQSYGISSDEALARVESLTDQEIALIVGRLDQLPAGGGSEGAFAAAFLGAFWPYFLIGAAIILIAMIMIDFVLLDEPTIFKF